MIRNKGVGVETNNAPNIENKREIEKCLSSGENMDKILEKIDPVAYKITKHNPNKWRTYLMSYLRTGSTISGMDFYFRRLENSVIGTGKSALVPLIFNHLK